MPRKFLAIPHSQFCFRGSPQRSLVPSFQLLLSSFHGRFYLAVFLSFTCNCMFVGPQAPGITLSAAQGPGQPEVCALSVCPTDPPTYLQPCWLWGLHFPCLFLRSLCALAHVWERELSALGQSCPNFIILSFTDCIPHPILTTIFLFILQTSIKDL